TYGIGAAPGTLSTVDRQAPRPAAKRCGGRPGAGWRPPVALCWHVAPSRPGDVTSLGRCRQRVGVRLADYDIDWLTLIDADRLASCWDLTDARVCGSTAARNG